MSVPIGFWSYAVTDEELGALVQPFFVPPIYAEEPCNPCLLVLSSPTPEAIVQQVGAAAVGAFLGEAQANPDDLIWRLADRLKAADMKQFYLKSVRGC